MVEIPGDNPVELSLSILATLDCRTSNVDRRVPVQPLLAEHREEGGEEGGRKTREEDCLNVDDLMRRACALRDRWDVAAKSGVVHLVGQDAEESSGLFVWVGLELGVDFYNEGGCYGREQTGLSSKSARVCLPSNAKDRRILMWCSGLRRVSL